MSSAFGRINAWTEMDRAGHQEIPARDGRRLELWAYLDAYTFHPGDEVGVKAHSTASSFDLEVVCDSGPGETVLAVKGIAGRRQETPRDAYAAGCEWDDSYTFLSYTHMYLHSGKSRLCSRSNRAAKSRTSVVKQLAPAIASTRLFRNGNSQAVRIPKALAYDSVDIEVEIERRGDELIVRPAKQKLAGLGAAFRKLGPHFRDFHREQPIQDQRDWTPGRLRARKRRERENL